VNIIYYILAVIAGVCIAIQAGVNTQLKQAVGNPFLASLISFAVGALVLFVYSLFSGNMGLTELANMKGITWWKWTGGVLGAIYVTAVIISAPKIGAASLISLIVAGQMVVAVLLDHFGLIGFPVHAFNLLRFAGVFCIVAGVFLIQRF
jgi:transporter family-2 protein